MKLQVEGGKVRGWGVEILGCTRGMRRVHDGGDGSDGREWDFSNKSSEMRSLIKNSRTRKRKVKEGGDCSARKQKESRNKRRNTLSRNIVENKFKRFGICWVDR